MTRLLIIIPAEKLASVRAAAGGVYGDVGQTAFVPAGSASGDAPATHWWLSGMFTAAELALLPALQVAFPEARIESYDLMDQPARPAELLVELGIQPLKITL